jgi:flagellar hook-associated protein 3 FlgL
MRISTDQQYARLLDSMQLAQSRMADLQGQLASGKRLTRPSDDPFAMLGAITYRSAKALADQHKHNADIGLANMRLAESAVTEMSELMSRANSIVISGANGATSQEGRQAMASEMQKIMDQLLATANSKSATGGYLFAGFKTDTKPFAVNPSGPPPITYQGDSGRQLIEVGPGNLTPANQLLSGEVLAAYTALEDAKSRLEAGDTAGLSGVSLQLVESASSGLRSARGDIGLNARRFTDAAQIAVRRSDDFTALISEREDADIAEVAVGLQAAQTTYQAALAAFSATHQTSLLDYIRG